MSLDTVIAETRKAVTDDAASAQLVFGAHGTLVGVTEVDIRTGAHTFTVDEPPALGGGDRAANPVQYALAALGSCQAITYRFWAEQLGIPFDTLSVRVEGDLDIRGFFGFDDAVRPGFSAIRVHVTVDGPEPAESYQRLAVAVDEHCPVLDLFSNPVPVTRTTERAG
ncbi:OsmC family protein [Sphaerisporangium perillae]|uniref:OsmC family protein n=1 Tax=Sphaerisporangium perillae TaxID=2935860 RepID=UPI00200DED3E|nr:OsmC family protein [Sphaerisporangium perillae]